MIKDKDLHYNMALYMGLMQQKYENVKEKRKQLQKVLFVAASKIQRLFRKYRLKKKTRAAIRIQRWWRRNQLELFQKKQKIDRFKRLFNGLVVLNFFREYCGKKSQNIRKNTKSKAKKEKSSSKIDKSKRSFLKIVHKVFPVFIIRKSALYAESKYILKYQQYLRQKFESDWQTYEKKLTKQLWKQINKKWVKIEKIKSSNKYLNDQDKEVDANEYIDRKLNAMYEQFHGKLQSTESSLKKDHQQILFALKVLQIRYEEAILKTSC